MKRWRLVSGIPLSRWSAKLTEVDRLLAGGKDVAEVSRVLQVTEATYYRWRNQFGGLKADDAKK